MPRPRNILPVIREKRRGESIFLRCWFGGRWHELGKKGDVDPATLRARLVAIADNSPPPPVRTRRKAVVCLTIHGLFAAFLESAAAPRDERDRAAVQRAGLLFGQFCGDDAAAASVDSPKLAAWRESLCSRPCEHWQGEGKGRVKLNRTFSARYIQRLTNAVKRAYRWAGVEGLVPRTIAADLQLLDKLPAGRAPSPRARVALTPADYEAGLKLLPQHLADMCRIIRATGMRPGELCSLTPAQVHRSGVVAVGEHLVDLSTAKGYWLYLPRQHKNAWRGQVRPVAVPVSVQAVLAQYLGGDQDSRPFRYSTQSFGRALRNAGVPWTLYRLRRAAITQDARERGARAAQARAGHSDLRTTSGYLDFDEAALFG